MKKMLLILVSGLLILCMAGSAMANPFNPAILNEAGTADAPNPINLAPGQSIVLSFQGTSIASAAFGTDLPYSYSVTPLNGGSAGDISVAFSHTNFKPTAATYTDTGVITLTNNAPVGKTFRVSISAGVETGNGATIEFGTASRNISSVPEFPTVAAPIAGIIGLLFVFGRRKEGL
jgi:hypothetical protein